MKTKYRKGQKLCAYSTNGKFHRVVWRKGQLWYKCIKAVGPIKLSELMYNYTITCKNCLGGDQNS